MDNVDSTNTLKLDESVLRQGGMVAVNGNSLYRCRDTVMDCLAKLLQDCTHASDRPFTIADVGTADGSTSLVLLNEIIGKIRQDTGKSRQIMIHYIDLPSNDFNRMFSVVYGRDGLKLDPDVFCSAIGQTMYQQCLPDKSVHLIISSFAAMILSKSPCRIQNGIYPTEENQIDIFNAQASSDWKSFLIMRGRELCPGGYLVVLIPGTTKQGEVLIDIKGGMDTLSHVLQTLVADGLIYKDELLDCNYAVALFRTEEDYALPFRENDKDLIESGLELISTRSFVIILDHPSFSVTNKDDATKKMYADRIVAGIKPWLYGTIYNGLSHSRTEQEREGLVETYLSRLWNFAYVNNDFTPQLGLIEVVARKRA